MAGSGGGALSVSVRMRPSVRSGPSDRSGPVRLRDRPLFFEASVCFGAAGQKPPYQNPPHVETQWSVRSGSGERNRRSPNRTGLHSGRNPKKKKLFLFFSRFLKSQNTHKNTNYGHSEAWSGLQNDQGVKSVCRGQVIFYFVFFCFRSPSLPHRSPAPWRPETSLHLPPIPGTLAP